MGTNSTLSCIGGFIAGPPKHVSKAPHQKLTKVDSQDNFKINEDALKTQNGTENKINYSELLKKGYQTPVE